MFLQLWKYILHSIQVIKLQLRDFAVKASLHVLCESPTAHTGALSRDTRPLKKSWKRANPARPRRV